MMHPEGGERRAAGGQTLNVMRLAAVMFLLACLGVTAALASQPSSDNPFSVAELTENAIADLDRLQEAVVSLPLAMALGAALAFRPRRRGTPPRNAAVIQTQIILAVVGSLVMLVVGASLARAFGIVGVASLIRYRARVDDPKDAVVMLSALAIGLASGVGLYLLSTFSTLFIMAGLWVIESFEPLAHKTFTLKVTSKELPKLQPEVEALLRRHRAEFELRTSSTEEISYEVQLPYERRTDKLARAIVDLDKSNGTAVEWDEKTGKKKAS